MESLILALHGVAAAILLLFGLHRLKLLRLHFRYRRAAAAPEPAAVQEEALPKVCVQCPVYNEPGVVAGLLRSVANLDWPADRLEIQILDDSTDGTTAAIERWLWHHPRAARRIRHLRRQDRGGFKAGALEAGRLLSDAGYFAVIDADFRPTGDFLRALMPEFRDPAVGVVQGRWDYTNRAQSWFTRLQGLVLDLHFHIDQPARHAHGLWSQFHGTAGIWRREALEAAGGWSADTVTEDLDLSIRAQLGGWRLVYRGDYAVHSELPERVLSFKTQQRRWAKGATQVARRAVGPVWRSSAPRRVKREALLHLASPVLHGSMAVYLLTFAPAVWVVASEGHPWAQALAAAGFTLFAGALLGSLCCAQYARTGSWRSVLGVVGRAPVLLGFGLAMNATCAWAAAEGLLRRGGHFVRPPKGEDTPSVYGLCQARHRRWGWVGLTVVEWAVAVLSAAGAAAFAREGLWFAAGCLAVQAAGFAVWAALSSRDLVPAVRREVPLGAGE